MGGSEGECCRKQKVARAARKKLPMKIKNKPIPFNDSANISVWDGMLVAGESRRGEADCDLKCHGAQNLQSIPPRSCHVFVRRKYVYVA